MIVETSKIYNGSWLSNVYVWISLELTLIHFNSALINNSNLSPVLVNFTTKNSQVHHHNTSHNTTTANPSSELRFENSSFSTDSSEYGEILGTAAAYKQDIRQPLIGCSLSEFTCLNGKCIPISKFCDRNNDCDDNSDEPRFCTSEYIFRFIINHINFFFTNIRWIMIDMNNKMKIVHSVKIV